MTFKFGPMNSEQVSLVQRMSVVDIGDIRTCPYSASRPAHALHIFDGGVQAFCTDCFRAETGLPLLAQHDGVG